MEDRRASGSAADLPLDSTFALISRVRGGDPQAREQLIARYIPLLMRWAHGRLPPGARGLVETSDLVQVTLIRVLDHLDAFESRREGAFLAYLRQTLMNVFRNELRRSVRDPIRQVEDDFADDKLSHLEEIIGRDVMEAYEAGLLTLPERMREAVILRLEFGFSHREIADAIGSPSANAARMLSSRALVKLSRIMANTGGASGDG